ncbi:5-beta-cholestane-3-alpha,7-alpha-diol 12-alpha-hydroxylase [Suncus etruscus]|uniref:5-beta-cholestane-3-alpha,7-alpha-diol 12-alpha-hydroxylase n=1 Tax=Suncus etruscus TaxID=109475 RepID=UPI00210FC4E2|nr:5-beta-cholestane-3-alpha,7-alpha-diol 12-alpha-hydroxylase [Suncus etruscus]
MILWTLVLGSLLVAGVGYLCLLQLVRQRRPHEPPLDNGPLPWLGHAIEYRKNMFEFLKRMRDKYGDVFTVQLGGKYFTFVMDPLSYSPILKEARKKLDFGIFAEKLVLQVFGFLPKEGDHQMIYSASLKHLKGEGLEELNKVMLDKLSFIILEPLKENTDPGWQEDSLFDFCYKVMFKAGYLSLFGHTKNKEEDKLQTEELFIQFRKFDRMFPRFVFSLLGPREWREIGRIKRFFYKTLSVQNNLEKDGLSVWISDMLLYLREKDVTADMQDKFNFMMLWASQGNTGPTSFWIILFLLKHPEAMQAVREEATQALREASLEGKQSFDMMINILGRTPVLDSVMEESLRLGSAPTLYRMVQEDYTLKTANGQEYPLRQGDIVILFPYLSVHMDPEIHPEPYTFKYDRFLNPNGSRKTDFYKGGKKIHHYTLPWGAGISICPGRFFALSEMKLFILMMVVHFDLELVHPDAPVPPIDPQRWGFGTTHPTHDVQFRYRRRPTQ